MMRQSFMEPRIEYVHASKYGNGAMVAEEFKKHMAAEGVAVTVHHIREVRPDQLPAADLYLFSSPGRFGKPTRGMRRFLEKVSLPAGTKFAILTTELAPQRDNKTGRLPTEDERAKWQRVIPMMEQLLDGKGLVDVARDTVFVVDIKGPLEEGWQKKVEAFVARIGSHGALTVDAAAGPAVTQKGASADGGLTDRSEEGTIGPAGCYR
jgi:flavodoxin